MRKFKSRQPNSLPFRFLLVLAGASLLLTALAPRTNAGLADYWDFEYPLGSGPAPAPELLSQPQGVLINQPLASNYNPTLALNVASGSQPGGFQPLQVDANFSWVGGTVAGWSSPGNWSPSGPPSVGDTALFDGVFINQPNLTVGSTVGTLHMATGVIQNVTISANPGAVLNISGLGILGTGILVDNINAVTLTITASLGINNNQAWTNNSGNLFTVSGANVSLSGNALTVNGTGNTLISSIISGIPAGSTLTKDGSGTLTLTGNNIYTRGTTVNGGTLLVNNTAGSGTGTGAVTVNNAGTTLGGTGTMTGAVTVNAGANIAPGNGGNNTAILNTGALTLASTSNFRVDINGTTVSSGYDRLNVATGGVTITGSNLVVTVGTTLSVGQTFTILNKVAAGAITGTFAQGSTVVGSDGTVFSVSYTGGDGNDIVLTVTAAPVPELSTWMGGALAIAGLAFTQRRRLRKLIPRRCAVGS
jgi:autotransporter-associated beta strand protein